MEKIFGVDFSGAKLPEKKIAVAEIEKKKTG
jgi:hypothetical protein